MIMNLFIPKTYHNVTPVHFPASSSFPVLHLASNLTTDGQIDLKSKLRSLDFNPGAGGSLGEL